MVLIDKGLENGMEFGHTDYNTGEGRFITHGQNHIKSELHINPELTVKERHKLSAKDGRKRNQYGITLYTENNIQIQGYVIYNPITEALSFNCSIIGNNGKKVRRLN